MTEPVAYLSKYLDKSTNITRYKPENQRLLSSDPLYTAEQLHQRVKMTQKQYDRLMWDKQNTDLSTCLEYFIKNDGNNDFGLPNEKLLGNLTQEDIARAWLNPEETIEIVPDMKWFVRSKEKIQGFYMLLGNLNELRDPWFFTKQDNFTSFAHQFDTKEESVLWVNPLTEAVQLPVEEE